MKNNFCENRATFGAWLPYRFILFGLPALFAICYFLCTTTSAACKKAPAARNTIQLVQRQLRVLGGLEILGGQGEAVLLGQFNGLRRSRVFVGQRGGGWHGCGGAAGGSALL